MSLAPPLPLNRKPLNPFCHQGRMKKTPKTKPFHVFRQHHYWVNRLIGQSISQRLIFKDSYAYGK